MVTRGEDRTVESGGGAGWGQLDCAVVGWVVNMVRIGAYGGGELEWLPARTLAISNPKAGNLLEVRSLQVVCGHDWRL